MDIKPQRDQQGRGQEAGAEGRWEVWSLQGVQGPHPGRGGGPSQTREAGALAQLTRPPQLWLREALPPAASPLGQCFSFQQRRRLPAPLRVWRPLLLPLGGDRFTHATLSPEGSLW